MSEMKPTPGPWTANYCKDGCYFKGKNRDGWTIDGPDMVPDYENPMFNEADARLIAEAGTVFHNTGLSPVQLVEMVKELRETLLNLYYYVSCNMESGLPHCVNISGQEFIDARAALFKCAGVE